MQVWFTKRTDLLDSFVPVEFNSWTVPFSQSSENKSSLFGAVNVVWFNNKLLFREGPFHKSFKKANKLTCLMNPSHELIESEWFLNQHYHVQQWNIFIYNTALWNILVGQLWHSPVRYFLIFHIVHDKAMYSNGLFLRKLQDKSIW